MLSNSYVRKLLWGIGFALFCFLIAYLYRKMLDKKNNVVLNTRHGVINLFSSADAVIFMIITFLAGIRLNTGSDFYNYYNMYNNASSSIKDIKNYFIGRNGYGLLSCIVKQFTDNEYAIFTVVAIILYGYLFYLINKETDDKAIALVCYMYLGFFANSINLLKQCIAMVFVMCFYRALISKKFLKAVIFGILASVFHFTAFFALIGIVVVVVIKPSPSMRFLRIAVIAGVIAAVILPLIITVIISIVPAASGYSIYIDWRRNNQIRLIIAVIGMAIMYSYLCFILIKNRDNIRGLSEKRYFEISLLLIGLFINIASVRIWVVQRVALYFYQFIILILPALLQSLEPYALKKKTQRRLLIIMFIYLIFCGIFFGDNEYYSYHTIFSGGSPIYDADYNRMFK